MRNDNHILQPRFAILQRFSPLSCILDPRIVIHQLCEPNPSLWPGTCLSIPQHLQQRELATLIVVTHSEYPTATRPDHPRAYSAFLARRSHTADYSKPHLAAHQLTTTLADMLSLTAMNPSRRLYTAMITGFGIVIIQTTKHIYINILIHILASSDLPLSTEQTQESSRSTEVNPGDHPDYQHEPSTGMSMVNEHNGSTEPEDKKQESAQTS